MKQLILLFVLIFAIGTVKAQSLHGGQVKPAGDYYIEVVNCSGYLEVYVYAPGMYPLRNSSFYGQVDLFYPDSSCVTEKLFPYSNDRFTAEPKRESFTSCDVIIHAKGLPLRATFTDFVCRLPND